MLITKNFLDTVGRRSSIARHAMVQAGDKNRIKALISFFISTGACEINFSDVKTHNLTVIKKKYSFMAKPLLLVPLKPEIFKNYSRLTDSSSLQASHILNGVIGLQMEQYYD